jgi:hypothetical protein
MQLSYTILILGTIAGLVFFYDTAQSIQPLVLPAKIIAALYVPIILLLIAQAFKPMRAITVALLLFITANFGLVAWGFWRLFSIL